MPRSARLRPVGLLCRRPPVGRQRGFALVAAIFLIVVGAFIAIYMARMQAVQTSTDNLALQGARAWQAANAGLEWGLQQASTGSCAASTSFTLTSADLNGFAVTVACSSQAHIEGSSTVTVYELTSEASYGASVTAPDYAYRKVQTTYNR